MSRPKRTLQKRFIVFCEGDTEYNYIDKMRKNQGVQISLKPINMRGGGYTNFLKRIKQEAKTNCLAKFIIVDGDRLKMHPGEKESFRRLVEYCELQNKKGVVPHFLIVNNPNFEYVACLHVPEYSNQEISRFLQYVCGFQTMEQFKKSLQVWERLNDGDRSYRIMVDRVAGKEKFVKNDYTLERNNFEVSINNTDVNWELVDKRSTNMEEFFDVINW